MAITLEQLAALVGGTVEGDGALVVQAARPLGQARAGDLTFLEDDRHGRLLKASAASAAIVGPGFAANGLPLIRVADPLGAFVAICRHLQGPPRPSAIGIDPLASVHSTARIGRDAAIHPFARVGAEVVIGDRVVIQSGAVVGDGSILGDDVTLHPHAVLYAGTVLGNRVTIHAGSVIGGDGFGYRFQGGAHDKIPQLGSVEIEDDVEIGANTTVDRGTFEVTRIGRGTKIDNLVQVAHNCRIGRHNILVSQAGIAGSCTTGDYVVIAGQAGIRDHLTLGDRVKVGAQAGVIADVPDGGVVVGTPARPDRDAKRFVLHVDRVPELRHQVRALQRRLEHLERRASPGTAAGGPAKDAR